MSLAGGARIRPVILSGGSGTRLWPLSRSDCPKQFLPLVSRDTMLQATARRVRGEHFLPPFVVANARHASGITTQLERCGIPADALILEPQGRNTAPAIALAAALAAEEDPSTLLLILPSDHAIQDTAAFHAAINNLVPVVDQGWLATFGIRPTGPETGYGYIELGEDIASGVRRAARFVEKPDLETALAYLQTRRFVWNGGIFLFRADALLDALEANAPEIRRAAVAAIAGAVREGGQVRPDPVAFAQSPSESIDYAVMEHWPRVAVAPVEMGWSDIGSWDALHEFSSRDQKNNHVAGEVVAIDTNHCLLRSEGPLLAAVGVSDLIIVATDDAVMVAPRGRSQDVRHIVSSLKQRSHRALDYSTVAATDWGSIRRLTNAGDRMVYEVIVSPGHAIDDWSAGATDFTVLCGEARLDGETCRAGARFEAGPNHRRSIANRGDEALHLLATVRLDPAG